MTIENNGNPIVPSAAPETFFRRFLRRLQEGRMETAMEVIYRHRDLMPPNYL